MYDMKTEPNEFIGDDRAEAVAKACRFFEVEESELKINEPAAGVIYGAGSRAVIVAYAPSKRGSGPPRDGGDRGGRGGDRGDRGDRGGRGGRGDRGGRGERGGRGDRDDRRETRGRSDEGGRERGGRGRDRDRDGDRDRDRDRGRDRDGDRDRDSDSGRSRAPVESKGTVRGEVGVIGTFLVGAIERMGLGSFEISEETEGDFLIYQIGGAAADELSAGDGRAMDALQLLANQAAMRELDESTRVIVDAEGDAERREGFLERLAERAAGRALDTGRSVALDPMNPKDRRILHITVREMDDVVTMSVGSGRYRQVVIVPKDAPEYEEALQAAKDASSRDRD